MESAEAMAMATVVRWSRVSGDLHIRNWENAPAAATVRLMVAGDARDPAGVESIAEDAILLVAVPITLTIDRVDGDVTIRGIRGRSPSRPLRVTRTVRVSRVTSPCGASRVTWSS